MTLPEWRLKQGTDWTAPNDIIVKVDGVAQDLTTGWTIAVWAKPGKASATAHEELTVSDDTALLEAGKVRLSLARDVTIDMIPGLWVIDVEATSDETGRQKSETFTLTVVDAVTDTPEPTP